MTPWQRLGQLVVARRVERGYRTRLPFADALGISTRTLSDLEIGRRDRYEPTTIASLENVLGWRTGSVQRILDGGNPLRVEDPDPAEPTENDDDALHRVMRSNLSPERKKQVARILIAQREEAERQLADRADELIRLLTDNP